MALYNQSYLVIVASELGVQLSSAPGGERLKVYTKTVGTIHGLLLNESPSKLPEQTIKLFERDFRSIMSGLYQLKDFGRGIDEAYKCMSDASDAINVALKMFNDKEEGDAATRLNNRFSYLTKCRLSLDKALTYLEPLVSTE